MDKPIFRRPPYSDHVFPSRRLERLSSSSTRQMVWLAGRTTYKCKPAFTACAVAGVADRNKPESEHGDQLPSAEGYRAGDTREHTV